jgi:hypothetical protein
MLICMAPPVCFLCSQFEFCAYKMQDASYTLLFIDPLVPLVTHKFVGFIFSCPYFVVLKDSVEDALKVTVSIFLKFDDKAER